MRKYRASYCSDANYENILGSNKIIKLYIYT